MIDLDKLEELARAATPGPWEARNVGDVRVHRTVAHRVGLSVRDHVTVRGQLQEAYAAEQQAVADAAFIAAANPAAVLELIERVRAAEARGDHLAAWVEQQSVRARLALLEAIVRGLAAENPHADARAGFLGRESVSADYVRGDWRCSLCGGAAGDQEVHAVDHHAKYCPWRRAVEATKP